MRTFRDFMESALYDPIQGFYSNRIQTQDFYTAPELHPAFGAVLADQIAELLTRIRKSRPSDGLVLIEAGCGNGTLAAQVARRLRQRNPALCAELRFVLLERSRRDLTEAVRAVSAFGISVEACTDIERLPNFSGVLYSNELFDAFPAHLLQKKDGSIFEVYVDQSGRWTLGGISSPELAAHAALVSQTLLDDEIHAVATDAPQWLSKAAARIEAGFLLTIDYGKAYSAQTSNVPRAFRAHRLKSDLLANPGLQDLTVPADFSALIAAGVNSGLETERFVSLSRFLLDGGIMDSFADVPGESSAAFKSRAQIKTLIHPDGMGEAFKVLIQRRPS